MIKFLLFVSIINLMISIFISPPEFRLGNFHVSAYTRISFRACVFFGIINLFT